MNAYPFKQKGKFLFRAAVIIVLVSFSLSSVFFSPVQAQTILNLSAPGTFIASSPSCVPPIIVGMSLNPDDPMEFNFIIDRGDDDLQGEDFQSESKKLINYFLAALAIPEDEVWVNLSPYEKDRIMADGLSQTEMGRDMLAQDYLLKQLSSSMMHPDSERGKAFWKSVYERTRSEYGVTEIPGDIFNKIWIVPEESVVFVKENNIFVVKSRLDVKLEGDYLAMEMHAGSNKHGLGGLGQEQLKPLNKITEDAVRNILLPAIKEEINNGKNFAALRQIFHSVILATWYKKNLKESVLGKIYADRHNVKAISLEDKQIREKVYQQYIKAYQTGIYDLIKEDIDPVTNEVIPRRYFGGGIGDLAMLVSDEAAVKDVEEFAESQSRRHNNIVSVVIPVKDSAMLASKTDRIISKGVKRLKTAEAVWVIQNLMKGIELDAMNISDRAKKDLRLAFDIAPEEIGEIIRKNSVHKLFAWPFGKKTLIRKTIAPQYAENLENEAKAFLTFINGNKDLVTAGVLNNLLAMMTKTEIMGALGENNGQRLLDQLQLFFKYDDREDFTTFLANLLFFFQNSHSEKIREIRRTSLQTVRKLWKEDRRKKMTGYNKALRAALESSDLDQYTQILIQAIETGKLKNADYLNEYLDRGLLESEQAGNYARVVTSARNHGITGYIVPSENPAASSSITAPVNDGTIRLPNLPAIMFVTAGVAADLPAGIELRENIPVDDNFDETREGSAMQTSDGSAQKDIERFVRLQSQRSSGTPVPVKLPVRVTGNPKDYAMLSNKFDKKISDGVSKLETSEAIWVINELVSGHEPDTSNISIRAKEDLEKAFALPFKKIPAMIKESGRHQWFNPSTWQPEFRRHTLRIEFILPEYDQILAQEAKKISLFIKNNKDRKIASLLKNLLASNSGEISEMLKTTTGEQLVAGLGAVFEYHNTKDLPLFLANLFLNIRNHSLGRVQEEARWAFQNLRNDILTAGEAKKYSAETTNGGIDFNAQMMTMKETGETFHYAVDPVSLDNLHINDIQILPPVITDIIPVTNFYSLLGLNKQENKDAII
ncbi:MAG: hypothetical protein AB1650_02755 [Candidatus Omnitrophota bacterium]